MSTKLLMDVEEYLHTSFDGSDCEYLDGEVVERNMGEIPHGDVQLALGRALSTLRPTLGIRVIPEIRIQIHGRRFRVADLAVWRHDDIGTGIPTVPPFLAIEILSPDDRMSEMLERIHDYLSFGVPCVWLLDPRTHGAFVYTAGGMQEVKDGILRTADPEMAVPLAELFD